nr:proline racemase family protein [Mesorhizobium amorphae]
MPSVGGWAARMTGLNTIFIDDRDPLAHGSSSNRENPDQAEQQERKRDGLCRRNDPAHHLILTAISSKWGA